MRNYIKLDNSNVVASPDGTSTINLSFFGQFAGQSISAAQQTANQLISGGYAFANAFQNPDIYVLMNKALIAGYLIQITQGSQPEGGQRGYALWTLFQEFSDAVGLDPFKSPKEQNVRPWSGRKR